MRLFLSSSHSYLAKLIALKIIAQSFIDNITELLKANTKWLPEFAAELMEEVETVANKILGVKAKTALFQATIKVNQAMAPARRDISTLKIQIDVNLKENPIVHKGILDDLGFTAYYKKITARNQIAVIGFLAAFNRNIETHRATILETGTPPELLTRIGGYAETVTQANVIQEQLKNSTKEISDETKAQLEDVYKKIIKVCLIAADYYKDNRSKKDQFVFDKVIANIGIIPEPENNVAPKA